MISVLQLGTIDYATGLRLQEQLVTLRKEGRIGDVLLLLEHTPVITLGRNAKADNVIASPELLAKRSVEVFECNRGGDVTFHGPGQLVAYPIFDLRGFPSQSPNRNSMGVIEFVRSLEEVLIRTCGEYGIPTKRISGLTGVWTGEGAHSTPSILPVAQGRFRPSKGHVGTAALDRPGVAAPLKAVSSRAKQDDSLANHPAQSRDLLLCEVERSSTPPEAKIAALGVHISRGVTSHGIALNVNTDLSFFNLIVPCGITSKPVTSIAKQLNREVAMQDVAHVFARNFGQVFSSQVLWLDSLDALLGNNLGIPMSPPENLRKLRGEDDTTWA